MMDQPTIMEGLIDVLNATSILEEAEETPLPGYWLGDSAAARQHQDNTGRLAFRRAKRFAELGVEAALKLDLPMAETYLHQARGQLLYAYQTVITAGQLRSLAGVAKRRGRKAGDSDLAERVSAAMAEHSDDVTRADLEITFRARPDLRAEFATRNVDEESLLRAIRTFRKNTRKQISPEI